MLCLYLPYARHWYGSNTVVIGWVPMDASRCQLSNVISMKIFSRGGVMKEEWSAAANCFRAGLGSNSCFPLLRGLSCLFLFFAVALKTSETILSSSMISFRRGCCRSPQESSLGEEELAMCPAFGRILQLMCEGQGLLPSRKNAFLRGILMWLCPRQFPYSVSCGRCGVSHFRNSSASCPCGRLCPNLAEISLSHSQFCWDFPSGKHKAMGILTS